MGYIVLAFILGIAIGCIATRSYFRGKDVGDLVINDLDPYAETLFQMQLNTTIETVCRKDYVMLKVTHK